jgi:hypothetical protein
MSVLRYFPSVSTLRFSSSFILLTTGSWPASPVVCMVLAGGALLGSDFCSGGTEAGRVAVALGGVPVWACDGDEPKRMTLDSSDAASVMGAKFSLAFIEPVFIDLLLN